MSESKQKQFRIFSIISSSLIVLTAIGFLFEVLRIFIANDSPMYSQEVVGKRLLELLPLIILTVLFIIFLGVWVTINGLAKKENTKLSNSQKYSLLKERRELPLDNEEFNKEVKYRRFVGIFKYFIFGVSLLIPFIYVLRTFDPSIDATEQLIRSLIYLIPWVIIGIIDLYVGFILEEKSYSKSIQMIVKNEKKIPENKSQKTLWIIRGVIFAAALGLIIYGVINNDHLDTLKKAVNICTECIGIG